MRHHSYDGLVNFADQFGAVVLALVGEIRFQTSDGGSFISPAQEERCNQKNDPDPLVYRPREGDSELGLGYGQQCSDYTTSDQRLPMVDDRFEPISEHVTSLRFSILRPPLLESPPGSLYNLPRSACEPGQEPARRLRITSRRLFSLNPIN